MHFYNGIITGFCTGVYAFTDNISLRTACDETFTATNGVVSSPKCLGLETPALCRVSVSQTEGTNQICGCSWITASSPVLIQKKWFDSLDSSSSCFLSKLHQVGEGAGWIQLLVDIFPKEPVLISPVACPAWDWSLTRVKAAPPQQGIPSLTWGVHGHPLQQEFAESTWLGFYVTLPWQKWPERRFLTLINPGQHPREYFNQIISNWSDCMVQQFINMAGKNILILWM